MGHDMARPLRIQFAGALYHVTARGNARQDIFCDDLDRVRFLDTLWSTCELLDWDVWAYCLMGNHYHVLLQTLTPTLSRGMRNLNGHYSQWFNFRHQRVGHLLQGRYYSSLVDKETYLLEVARYILLNPVRSGLCEEPGLWPWSSYRATAGRAPVPGRLVVERLIREFGEGKNAYDRFVTYIRAGISEPDPAETERLAFCVGGERFVSSVARLSGTVSREVPRSQRTWKSLDQYEAETRDRNAAIQSAYASGTYTLAEIGRHFGLHYVSVGRIVRRVRAKTLQGKT